MPPTELKGPARRQAFGEALCARLNARAPEYEAAFDMAAYEITSPMKFDKGAGETGPTGNILNAFTHWANAALDDLTDTALDRVIAETWGYAIPSHVRPEWWSDVKGRLLPSVFTRAQWRAQQRGSPPLTPSESRVSRPLTEALQVGLLFDTDALPAYVDEAMLGAWGVSATDAFEAAAANARAVPHSRDPAPFGELINGDAAAGLLLSAAEVTGALGNKAVVFPFSSRSLAVVDVRNHDALNAAARHALEASTRLHALTLLPLTFHRPLLRAGAWRLFEPKDAGLTPVRDLARLQAVSDLIRREPGWGDPHTDLRLIQTSQGLRTYTVFHDDYYATPKADFLVLDLYGDPFIRRWEDVVRLQPPHPSDDDDNPVFSFDVIDLPELETLRALGHAPEAPPFPGGDWIIDD